MRDQSIFRNASLFPMSEDQLYIHVSVIYNPFVLPYEYFLRRYSYTETNHTNNN